ncbi:YgeY family selenium metabolism-linked hydrolase [Caldilinea sp.]|uniref:YgeY family selenium metabolism-linked hydrolase n=1 Tax=Caldilinea sp. TaxID=2293560 RepID=UPI002D1887E2|nr:YgeY family selenium metabolism-linked hydrolase [Anaerolineales bacterium]HQY92349.1 YgeY family selenium metabolism-linked hydrolase [Caldilinea sp.]HRA68746.1 YgeY family selenium metabolism-linked hydrolase [Caldilinea sp.]
MNTDRLIVFTQDLVRIPSLSGEESGVAARVQAEMEALGFDRVWVDANGSVVGVIEGGRPGKTVLLDAHIDTVGISPGAPWEHDPFGAAIDQGAIYGRGAADMKGALAAMVHAAAALDRATLAGRVLVSASTLEEVLEGVALHAVMDATQPDFVIIGESTDLNLSRGGRGRAEVHLTTVGRPSHSSAPHLGRNAVLDMMRVIAAVEQITLSTDPIMGPAIFALTDIISAPHPGHSVIPNICKVTYDRRLLPDERRDDVLAAITSLSALADIQLQAEIAVDAYTAFTGATLRSEKFFPAWLLPEDDAFVATALAALNAAGIAARPSAYRFCTNAAYSAGLAGVPTVGFGPATEADAHVIDERLRLDDLLAAAKGYRAIIEATLAV